MVTSSIPGAIRNVHNSTNQIYAGQFHININGRYKGEQNSITISVWMATIVNT